MQLPHLTVRAILAAPPGALRRGLRLSPPPHSLSASALAVVWPSASLPLQPAADAFLHPPRACLSNHELRELFGCGGMLCSRPNGHILPGYIRRIHPDPGLHAHAPATTQPGPPGFGPYE